MKIKLASYLEPENFSTGRLISIADSKPDVLETDGVFEHFMPNKESLQNYFNLKLADPKKAALKFEEAFSEQLERFREHALVMSESLGVSVFEVLPFCDNDTLLSWERKNNANYRKLVAKCLTDLGYEVECY